MPNYVTQTEVGTFLGIDLSNAYLQSEIDDTILLAESVVDNYVRTTYAFQNDLELVLSGYNQPEIKLPYPCVSVSSVKAYDSEDTLLETYASSSYRLGPPNPKTGFYRYIIKTDGVFPAGTQNIKVTGDFGFADTDDTHNVFKLGVYYVVKAIFDSKAKGTFDLHTRSEMTTQIFTEEAMQSLVPMLARVALNPYIMTRQDLRR